MRVKISYESENIFKINLKMAEARNDAYSTAFIWNDSEYCEILKTTYFEANLKTAASENVFMNLRKIKSC